MDASISQRVLIADAESLRLAPADAPPQQAWWPVGNATFHELVALVYAAYDDVYVRSDGALRAAVSSDQHFVQFLIQHAHALLVRRVCQERGVSIVASGASRSYYDPDWEALASTFERSRTGAPSLSPLRTARRRLKNRHAPTWARLLPTRRFERAWFLGALTDIGSETMAARKLVADFPVVEELLAVRSPARTLVGRKRFLPFFTDAVTRLAARLAEGWQIELPVERIADTWSRRCATLAGDFEYLTKRSRWPRTILVGAPGNPYTRIAAHAGRAMGAKVMVLQHGHNPGFTALREMCELEFSIADEYVCLTPGMLRALTALAANHMPRGRKAPRFASLDSPYFEQVRERSQARPREARTATVIGFPAGKATRYSYGWGEFLPIKIGQELTVIRALRARGYKVVYQPHPESRAALRDVIGPHVDEFRDGSFEATASEPELVVFTHPFTTTFCLAVAGTGAVLLFDAEGRKWTADILDAVRRRVGIVSGRFDEDSRYHFDAPQLDQALRDAAGRATAPDFFRLCLSREGTDAAEMPPREVA